MVDPLEPQAEGQRAENRSRRGRIPAVTDWLSVVLAVLALLVSLLGYRQSQKAQEAARESQQRGGATKVGFWRQEYTDPQVLNVFNRNAFDIDDVTITFSDGYYIRVGLVPSCHGWTLAGFSTPANGGGTYTLPFPARLDFRDQDAPPGRWTIDATPPHRQEAPPTLPADKDATQSFRARFYGPYFVGCAS
ncbi:hypothetical protein ACFVZH_08390 [Streptomyces sp. NPDC059534]|uniref:hypothetical protein n=1 Tax=Streptomyces sp. NPDC059534 TaxID=3346859 RepID=UPI0036741399